jgi:hypothetical protein
MNSKTNTIYCIPWTNNRTLQITEPITLDPWSSNIAHLRLVDDSHNISQSIQLAKSRHFLGVYPMIHHHTVCVFYVDDLNSTPYVLVDFYKIDETSDKISIYKTRQHKIKSDSSCGSTTGRVCPSTCEPDTFYVFFGDLTNDEYVSMVECNMETYKPARKIKYTSEYEHDIEHVFWVEDTTSSNMVYVYSNAICHDITRITLEITTIPISGYIHSIITIQMPKEHSHGISEYRLIDSMLVDVFRWNAQLYSLVRLKLHRQIDPLHVQHYFLDVIVRMDGPQSTLVDISQPIFYDTSDEYTGYYGVRPYWHEITNADNTSNLRICNVYHQII